MIKDPFGRCIRYLRLSITSACPLHCAYCRPRSFTARSNEPLLTPDEIENLVRHLVTAHGLTKLRLTGGEPTARADLLEIVRRVAAIPGLRDVAMTTNGLALARHAKDLAAAGLKRVNISIDTLVPEKYQRITGSEGLAHVLEGIDAAMAAGLSPKLNTVVVRGENDHELADLMLFAAWKKLEIRFIELMPMGPLAERWKELYVSEQEMRERLAAVVTNWVGREQGSAAARRYCAGMSYGRNAQVGFISAMSCPFCDTCDRIRIGSDGSYYPCLMNKPAASLLAALRPFFEPGLLDAILAGGLANKAREHPTAGLAVMTEIGG